MEVAMKRSVVFGVLTCVLVTAMAVRMQGQQGPGGKGNGAADGPEGDSRIQIGFRIAPVPLNLEGKNPALVGLGSYIVNAQGDCAGCHSNPQYAPGGDPHFGEPELTDPAGHLRGGLQLFGPEIVPRNLTPNAAGRPGGLTLDQFLEVFSIGTDFDNAPPVVPGPHSSDLLQVMPWPVFSKMTDREKRAIYEYLRAIPCLPAGSARCT
jgi:hypothetical protein